MQTQLQMQCSTCTRCALCSGRTHSVFGEGAEHAKIMLVGEGPGQTEDELGRPFVGRSGQLLDSLLAKAGLSRKENVYITNIVKCRPPKNRDPLPEEREACLFFLREQFKLLRPEIIVCIGRIASIQLIRPDFSVTKEHGLWQERKGVFFMGTFHPAALLRNPNNTPFAIADFEKVYQKAQALHLV